MYQIDYMKEMGKKIREKRVAQFIYYTKNNKTCYRSMLQRDFAKKIDEILKPNETKNDPNWDHNGRRVQVSNWEHGKGKLTLDDAIAICKVLNVDINYLLGVTKHEKPLELVIQEREESAGLTEKSCKILKSNPTITQAINHLLESDAGIEMLLSFYRFHNEKREG